MKVKQVIKYLSLLVFGLFWLTSCDKDCMTSTGTETTVERTVSDFKHIQVWDNVDVQITQATENRIQVKAGDNIIENIETSIQNGILKISNLNSCNWVRSYDKDITVFIDVKDLYELEIHGTGEVSSNNTIVSDSLMLNVWDAAGKVDLAIETQKSTIRYHIGTADIFYSGTTRLSYISSNSFGPVDARNLKSEQTYISSLGSNNNYVWATEILEATISSIGTIYYKDDPVILRTFINGSGEVKKIQP